MKKVLVMFSALVLFCASAWAQRGLEGGLAFSHKTGGGAANGVELSGQYGLNQYFSLVAEFTPYWGASTVATTRTSSKEQDYMFGPRFVIPHAFSNRKLVPVAQLLYGVAHTSIKVKTVNGPTISEDSATAWAWDLGGGLEYLYRPKWKLRGKVSLFKTHFADQSQANAKFAIGIVYCFGKPCSNPTQ